MKVGPGTKDYGALSLAVQFYSRPDILMIVSANCFVPRPNVDSAVIKLTLHKEMPVTVKNESLMFTLIRAAFNQRRKTMVNALTNAGINNVTKENVLSALEKMNLPATIRGEALTLAEFATLSDYLS